MTSPISTLIPLRPSEIPPLLDAAHKPFAGHTNGDDHTSDQIMFQSRAALLPVHGTRLLCLERCGGKTRMRVSSRRISKLKWAWIRSQKSILIVFIPHQPDLNFDNPAGTKRSRRLRFWLGLGVDGLRLDAVPYLYEREGTICENLPRPMTSSQAARSCGAKFPKPNLPPRLINAGGRGRLLGKARSHMNFHFPLMPRMFMALQMEEPLPT